MLNLYDTEKELFFTDYKPIPTLSTLTNEELTILLDNLVKASDNACIYHSELLELALLEDIEMVKQTMTGRGL